MPDEIVQDRLPTLTLQLLIGFRLRIKRFLDQNSIGAAQIDGALSRVSVIRGCVPLLDVLGVVPCSPGRIQIALNESFDSDVHWITSFLQL